MVRSSYVFTSESVSEGHPDKVADRISDTVVDAFIEADPEARVACETMVTTNRIILAGEVRASKPGQSKAESKAFTKEIIASLQPKVRAAVKDIGYEQKGFHWEKARYANYLHGQSAHIAQGVDSTAKKDEGAGDQGIMFGYACSETPELMPATLQYSHNILKRLAEVRHSGERVELEPDAKSQVTLRYENGKPVEVVAIVVSHQHKKKLGESSYSQKRFADLVRPYAESVFPAGAHHQENQVAHQPDWQVPRSAVPTAIAVSPAARSLSTPMAAPARTAAAPSPARTQPKSIAPPLTRAAIWPRTSLLLASRSVAPFRSATRLASLRRRASMSTSTAPTPLIRRSSKRSCRN